VPFALGYNFDLQGMDCRVQLNAYNLTDNDPNYGYVDLEPRSFRLSARFAF
jgi:outer membrane receptor protein involved in Fe transport